MQELAIAFTKCRIDYFGRTYEEGKKITFFDGVAAVYFIFKYNLFVTRKRSFRADLAAADEKT